MSPRKIWYQNFRNYYLMDHVVLLRVFEWYPMENRFKANTTFYIKLRYLLFTALSVMLMLQWVPKSGASRSVFCFFSLEIVFVLSISNYVCQKNTTNTLNSIMELYDSFSVVNLNPYRNVKKKTHWNIFAASWTEHVFAVCILMGNIFSEDEEKNQSLFKFIPKMLLTCTVCCFTKFFVIIGDHFRCLNEVLEVLLRTENKRCNLCQFRRLEKPLNFQQLLKSLTVSDLCVVHHLKYIRILYQKTQEVCRLHISSTAFFMIFCVMTIAAEMYLQSLYWSELLLFKYGSSKNINLSVLLLNMYFFVNVVMYSTYFLTCCEDTANECKKTGVLIHQFYYKDRNNLQLIKEMTIFSYQLAQKPLKFVFYGVLNADWSFCVTIFRHVTTLAIVGIQMTQQGMKPQKSYMSTNSTG